MAKKQDGLEQQDWLEQQDGLDMFLDVRLGKKIKQRDHYKYAKMACLHRFAVTQSDLGAGTEMDLTENQKKR